VNARIPWPRTVLVAASLLTLAAGGCGSVDDEPPVIDGAPTTRPPDFSDRPALVVDPEVDGIYAIASPSGLEDARFIIATEFAELEITTACGQLLGSFTMLRDMTASITVAGGTPFPCSDEETTAHRDLRDLLGRVSNWQQGDNDLRYTTPDGSELVLTPVS